MSAQPSYFISGQPPGEQVLVPDSIEPLIGYKWLQVGANDGLQYLYSGFGNNIWPMMEPMEASCTVWRGWKWEQRPWEEVVTQAQWIRGMQQSPVTVIAQTSFVFSSAAVPVNNFQHLPPKPEAATLYGHDWSVVPAGHCEDSPGEGCSCGIYMGNTIDDVDSYARPEMVLLRIATWGKVIRGEYASRSQYAYPQAILHAPSVRKAREIARNYGIPIEANGWPDRAEHHEESTFTSFADALKSGQIAHSRVDWSGGNKIKVTLNPLVAQALKPVKRKARQGPGRGLLIASLLCWAAAMVNAAHAFGLF